MKTRLRFTTLCLLAIGGPMLVLAGCSAKSPAEPGQEPLQGETISGRWAITIEATDNRMMAGGDSIVFTATIVNRDSGAAPPDGATAVVTTSMGLIGDPDPAVGLPAAALPVFGGGVTFEVFSGEDEGTATVEVTFQNATGRRNVQITEELFLFLESIIPNSGDKGGGYTVRITGQGFDEPMRVEFGGIVALVTEVRPNQIRVRVPSVPVDRDIFDGEFSVVDVTVTIFGADGEGGAQGGASDTLPSAFTYIGSGDPPMGGGVCGDGTVDAGEQCDDGNFMNGDGCSNTCQLEP